MVNGYGNACLTNCFSFKKDDKCRDGIWNKQTQPEEQTLDKHLAVCADFCTHDDFTYFGITVSTVIL